MTYSILVEHQQPDSYTATVLGWPDCTAQGATRQEALVRVRQALSERLANADVVSVEIETPQKEHPWLKFDGMFRDNPLFDDVIAEIENYRHELDADQMTV